MSEKKARPNFENLVEKASDFIANFDENFSRLDLKQKKAMTIADFLRSDSITRFIKICQQKGLDHNKTRVALNRAIGYAIRPSAFNIRAKELGFEIKSLGISRKKTSDFVSQKEKESRERGSEVRAEKEITPVAIAPGEISVSVLENSINESREI